MGIPGFGDRPLHSDERSDRRGQITGEGDLHEDQRFPGKQWVEEREAASVGGQARTQIVPSIDLVHRLVGDQPFQRRRRRPPADLLETQEAPVEPGREEVAQVGIDAAEMRTRWQEGKQLAAQLHQRSRTAPDHVEPPEQLLSRRLGGPGKCHHRLIAGLRAPLSNGRLDLVGAGK